MVEFKKGDVVKLVGVIQPYEARVKFDYLKGELFKVIEPTGLSISRFKVENLRTGDIEVICEGNLTFVCANDKFNTFW